MTTEQKLKIAIEALERIEQHETFTYFKDIARQALEQIKDEPKTK